MALRYASWLALCVPRAENLRINYRNKLELATGNLAKAEKAAASFSKELSGKGKLSEASDALRGIRDQTKDVAESLTAAFTPLEGLIGGIAAGGIIGGLALMAERFANLGAGIGRTSAGLGLATQPLQQFTGAADLAGVGADTMTTSLQGLAQGVYRMAQWPRPSDVPRII
jgi:hypothetical protein